MLLDVPKSRDREAWLDCYVSTYLHYYAMQPSARPRDREIADRWAHEMVRAILCYEWAECYNDPGAKLFPRLRETAIRERLPRAVSEFHEQRRQQREEETLRFAQQHEKAPVAGTKEAAFPNAQAGDGRQLSLF